MTKNTKRIIGAISVGVVLISLITLFVLMRRAPDLTVQAPAPPRVVTPTPLPPPVPSIIAVEAKVAIADVRTLAESTLRDYLRKPIQSKDGAIDTAIKIDLDTFTMQGAADGTVSVDTPFQFNGWVRLSTKIFGRSVQKREDIQGHATASLTLTPTLHSDWRITAKTTANIAIEKAEINILSTTLSVRRILTKIVEEKVLPKLESLIIKHITNIDVKTRVAGLWTKLYEPIVLTPDPFIALTIEPIDIQAQQLSSDGETLALRFGIKTYMQIDMGNEATDPQEITITELPDIHFVDTLESGYHIVVPIEMTYPAVENLAKPHIEKRHQLKGIDTHVEDLTLYGSGTQLVAGVQFNMPTLGANGQLYLLGTPIYDAATLSIVVTEFNYALTTQGLLLNIAHVAGESFFPDLRTTVEEKLIFPLETQLTSLRETLATVIAERPIGPYVVLRGTVGPITPIALYLTQTGVHIPFRLQGDLACEIKLKTPQIQN